MKEILPAIAKCMHKRRAAVLAVVLRVEGSAPRGVGAAMLVTGEGLACGTVGGGAVELAALRQAAACLAAQRGGVWRYPLHTAPQSIGAVCGGEVSLLFCYLPPADALWQQLPALAAQAVAALRSAWLVLPLAGGPPALLARAAGGPPCLAAGSLPGPLEPYARPTAGVVGAWLVLPLAPGERALLFGGGHCGQALAPLLASVGFRVTVYDDRPALATPARFTQAERVICAPYSQLLQHLAPMPEDYAVVMTSGHTHDLIVEQQLLRLPLAYIGAIGSRAKAAAVNRQLREQGIPQQAIDAVHTPIGLAIGAATPAEIAVSIAAEMIAVRAARRKQAAQQSPAPNG